MGWENNSFFFLASIVEYFLLMFSRNLFLATGSMLSCFFLCFLLMRFLLISVILHEQQINCILFSIVWHSCLFWMILLISCTRSFTPRMWFVCFIAGEWPSSYIRRAKTIALLLYFFDKYKLYGNLKTCFPSVVP